MTNQEFKTIANELGFTVEALSRLLFRSASTITGYRLGQKKVPDLVAARLLRIKEVIDNLANEKVLQ